MRATRNVALRGLRLLNSAIAASGCSDFTRTRADDNANCKRRNGSGPRFRSCLPLPLLFDLRLVKSGTDSSNGLVDAIRSP